MSVFLKISYNLLFVTLLYSTTVFSGTEFNDAYEAAQKGNHKKAVSLWTSLAEDGDAAAQYTLGWMFESGQGVKKNEHRAITWYTKAAHQGDVAAQYVLATIYKRGSTVKKDSKQAILWLMKAANQDHTLAQFELGMHFKNGLNTQVDHKKSLYWFQKAAMHNHISAQINIGKIYQSSKEIKVDYQKAIKWYRKAADQNNALGQYHLAQMYEYGYGVKVNINKAHSLYLQSANNAYAPATYKLAEFYELGKGTDVNVSNAIKWYTQAAQKGHSAAQFKLGQLYQQGKGVAKSMRNTITWYTLAAEQQYSQAHYQLGLIYKQGVISDKKSQAIKVNYKKAFHHLQQASQLNYPEAHAHFAYFYEHGLATDVDLLKASELYKQSRQPWAVKDHQRLNKILHCYNTATTALFSIHIACTTRKVLREKIKEQGIVIINKNEWSDTYFTGAVIPGSSELQVTYTQENAFVSATYTFVGRDNPKLVGLMKDKLSQRYGKPDKKIGTESTGPVSFKWQLDDAIILTVSRLWPDTTTFVHYFLPETKALLDIQQKQFNDKYKTINKQKNVTQVDTHFF